MRFKSLPPSPAHVSRPEVVEDKKKNLQGRGVIYQILGNSSLCFGWELAAKIAGSDEQVLRGTSSKNALYDTETENNYNFKISLPSPWFIWSLLAQ